MAELEGKYFYIRSRLNGMSLDLFGGEAAPGGKVVPYWHHGQANQLWWEDKVYHCIRSKVDEDFVLQCSDCALNSALLALKRDASSGPDGLAAEHFIFDGDLVVGKWERGNSDQKWVISGERIHHFDDMDKVLDIAGANPDANAMVLAYTWHGGDNQCWDFVHVEPRYMYIRSEMNGKFLDVKGDSTEAGAKVVTYARKDGLCDNQLWWEDKEGYIRSKLTGFALDFDDERIRCNPYEDKPTQHWIFNGKTLCNFDNRDECVQIRGEKDKDGASLDQGKFFNQSNQRWQLDYVSFDDL